MATVYCSNCGASVEGTTFCATCGTAVGSATAAPGFASPVAPSNTGKSMQTGRLGFVDAIKSFFNNYANFEGRATQSAFWFAYLFVVIIGNVASGIDRGISGSNTSSVGVLSSVVSIAFLLPNLAVGVRRLHDTGRSGHKLWWGLLPIVGWIMIIVWLASGSEQADNKYGPRP